MYAFVLSADHGLRPGQLPGQASGVYLSVSECHGVRRQQHPLPEGGVWRVSPTERHSTFETCYFVPSVVIQAELMSFHYIAPL